MQAKKLWWTWVGVSVVLLVAGWLLPEEWRGRLTIELAVGAVIAVLFAFYLEVAKAPDLTIALWEEGQPQDMKLGCEKIQVVHLQAVNRRLPRLLRQFGFVRDSAIQAWGNVYFYDMNFDLTYPSLVSTDDAKEKQCQPMRLRWDNTRQLQHSVELAQFRPEACSMERRKLVISDPERLETRKTIETGEVQGSAGGTDAGVFSIAHVHSSDHMAFGTSNDCYKEPFWRPEAWKLEDSDYLVKVIVRADNAYAEGVFHLSFSGPERRPKLSYPSSDTLRLIRSKERASGLER